MPGKLYNLATAILFIFTIPLHTIKKSVILSS